MTAKDMPELKPCPFCGSTRIMIETLGDSHMGVEYYAKCPNCWTESDVYNTEKELTRFWNRRADEPSKVAQLIRAIEGQMAFWGSDDINLADFTEAEAEMILDGLRLLEAQHEED